MTHSSPLRISIAIAIVMIWALGAPGLADAQQLVPLVTDQTPLALSNSFGVPLNGVVNQAGDFAFRGADNQAIFLRRAGSTSAVRLLQMGDEVPGFPGSSADLLGPPFLNNAGLVAFRVDCFRINGRATGVILTFDGTTLQPIVSGLDAAPDGGGALFERGVAPVGLNEAGGLVFTAPLVPSNSGVPNQTTLFIMPAGGAPVRVAGLGDVAPDTEGATFTSFAFFGKASLNTLGEVLFLSNLSNGGRGFFVGSVGGVRKVVATTDSNLLDPPSGTFAALGTLGKLNNAGQVAFAMSTGSIWLNTVGSGNSRLTVFGSPVPALLGGTFGGGTPTLWALNDAGEVAFTQNVLGSAVTAFGFFRYRPGNPLEVVTYRNQPAPGVPGRVFFNFAGVSMNSTGLISFRVVDVADQAVIGMFQQSTGALPASVVLNGEATTLPGGGAYILSSTTTETLDNGSLYFRADIAGGAADYAEFLRSAGGTINLISTADTLPAGARVITRTFRLGAAGNWVGFFMQRAAGQTNIGRHNITTQATEVVISDNDVAPGTGGGRIRVTNGSSVFVNANGTIAFSANIVSGTPGITSGIFVREVGGSLAKVVVNTDADPAGGFVGSAAINGVTRSPLNDAGQVVFIASNRLYVGSAGSAPVRVAIAGDSLPGIGTVTGFSFTGDFHINASGDVTFVASSATGSGLYIATPGAPPVKVAATGDAAPGGGTFSTFERPVLNNNGEILFGAFLTGGPGRAVFLRTTAPSLVALAGTGDPAPGGGTFDFFGALLDVALNDQQDVLFRANVVGGTSDSGYFVRRGPLGAIEPLLVQGQPAPGTGQVFGTIVGGLNGLARENIQLGPAGDVAIQANFIDVDGQRTVGIWHAKPNNSLEVIVTRGEVDVEFGGGAAVITTPGGAWNSGGRFAITARVSGGTFTDGIFLFVPTTTAPTPEGTNVVVIPPDATTGTTPVTMAFSDVSEAGETSVTTSAAGPTVPTAFQIGDPPVFYNLETTAVFNGAITVCVDFSGVSFPNGAPLALLHFENGAWQDVTTSGPTNNVICGTVTSLSPFTVAQVLNRDPVANAGADQTVECCGPNGATVTLNGTGSSDPDLDTLTYVWTDSSDVVVGTSASLALTLSRGTYTFTLTVTDPHGFSLSAVTHVTVQDTVAPALEVTMTPGVILVPNNKLVAVTASIQVSDLCDEDPDVVLVSITSNEALASDDIQGAVFGTDDRTFELRATRAGKGSSRIYTITYRVTDSAGNSTVRQAQVVIPHDRGEGGT